MYIIQIEKYDIDEPKPPRNVYHTISIPKLLTAVRPQLVNISLHVNRIPDY